MSTIVVQHPTLPTVFRTIPGDQAEAWKEQGWKRVKKDDIPEHLEPAPPTRKTTTE